MKQLTAEEVRIVTAAGDEVMRRLRTVCAQQISGELEFHIILTVAQSAVATLVGNGVDPLDVLGAIATCAARVKAGEMPLLPRDH